MFESLEKRFDYLYQKRAFVHWYVGEGLSEGFFSEAREDLAGIIHAYQEFTLNDEDGEDN